jgi:hypothetical protein
MEFGHALLLNRTFSRGRGWFENPSGAEAKSWDGLGPDGTLHHAANGAVRCGSPSSQIQSAEGMRLAKYWLGVLLNQNGQFEEAIEVLTPASGPGRLDQEIRTALGMALLRIPSLPPRTPLISRQLALTRIKRLLSANNPSPPCASAGDLHGIHFSSRLDDSLLSR